jgi:hypothetical protein
VVESDDDKKRDLLKQSLAADPNFVYAVQDLEALERRMLRYAAAADREHKRSSAGTIDAAHAALANKDPQEINAAIDKMVHELWGARRYRRLLAELGSLLAGPSSLTPKMREELEAQAIQCHAELFEWSAVLRDGEKFLATHPGSKDFQEVRETMDEAMEQQRLTANGAKTIVTYGYRKVGEQDRKNPCIMAPVFEEYSQWKEARDAYQSCAKTTKDKDELFWKIQGIAWSAYHAGDFRTCSAAIERLRNEFQGRLLQLKEIAAKLPVDD